MVILNAIQSVFTIFILVGIGYILTKKGWFNDETSKLFSKLVTKVSLPAFMFSNLMGSFTKEKLNNSLKGILVPFLSMLLSYVIGVIISKIIKIPKNRRGLFYCMFSMSNTIFIGLPVSIALFGEDCVPYVLLYYVVNTLFFWTIGVYGIKRDGGEVTGRFFELKNLKNIFSPPLISFIISILFIQLKINPPKAIMDSAKYIGNMTTPISTLFIGITITSLKVKDIRLDLESILVLAARFIIAPLLVVFVLKFIDIPLLMKEVFIIEAALPVMTQAAIVAKAYNADYKYATIMTTLSTALSLIFIPIYMVIFSYFL